MKPHPHQPAVPWRSGDYYRRLGVVRGAASEEIEGAYRKLAIRYQRDPKKLESFRAAYEALMAPESRRRHDAELLAKQHARSKIREAQRKTGRDPISGKESLKLALDIVDALME